MQSFLNDDFLLGTNRAKKMFQTAQRQPIFDWHCHLSPQEIYENQPPDDIAQLWLGGDHYKWRAMRSCGVAEANITGGAAGEEKFRAWAACLPKLIGNPLYHWTHLELRRFFGIEGVLNERSAGEIWREANAKIRGGGFAPRELIAASRVAALCTTDDPADSLDYHRLLAKERLPFRVLPAFRPDKALHIAADGFLPWLKQLEQAVGHPVKSFHDLRQGLLERAERFDALGCRASDHGLCYVPFAPATELEIEQIFHARLLGNALNQLQIDQYQTALLQELAAEYHRRGWAMELHIGPMRNNNTRLLRQIGPDAGFDSIGDWPVALPLSRFLDSLDEKRQLPKTVLFNLNPRDSYVLASMAGNFQSGGAGKLQYGPAWWFLDHIEGMRAQLATLANLGALGTFIGMVTDSRSFLSYPRHEYFRRVFCGFCGELAEQGLYPDDGEALDRLTEDVCYGNAARYFGLA